MHNSTFRFAKLTVTLANQGAEAYRPELYGNEIRIVRRIGLRQSDYKVLSKNSPTNMFHRRAVS
jgi:hypothetical protein